MKKIILWFKKYAISTTTLVILVALYQSTVLNIAYYKQVLNKLDMSLLDNIIFFVTMPVVIFCVIFAVLNACIFPRLIKFVSLLFILIGAPLAYFMSTFSIMIDRDMLQNALDTTSAESSALMTSTLIFYIIVFGVIPALIVLFVNIKPVSTWFSYILRRLLSISAAVVIIFLVGFFFYKDYAAFMRNNHGIIKYLMPSNYIAAIYKQYEYIQTKNLPFVTIAEDAYQDRANNNNQKKTLLILVLGETTRAQNFSLGNYARETNPLLSQRNIIYFNETSSCGTSTAYSLPCMFSNMPRTDYDEGLANRQTNALDILQSTGVNVLWQENDGGCKGVCDRVTYVDMTAKNSNGLCKDGVCYDDILFEGLDGYIQQLDSDSLIVLHTIGSHGPTYYQRYPDSFKRFIPTCDTNEINLCDQQSLINTYDNTVLYADHIVDRAISLAESYQDKYNTAVIYVSDHGESLGENGIYLHSMPYSIAPDEQTQVPFVLWLSDGYKQQHGISQDCIEQQAKKQIFSHDNIFHSLLGSFNIRTKEYESKLDVLQSCQTNVTE